MHIAQHIQYKCQAAIALISYLYVIMKVHCFRRCFVFLHIASNILGIFHADGLTVHICSCPLSTYSIDIIECTDKASLKK